MEIIKEMDTDKKSNTDKGTDMDMDTEMDTDMNMDIDIDLTFWCAKQYMLLRVHFSRRGVNLSGNFQEVEWISQSVFMVQSDSVLSFMCIEASR